MTPFPIWHDDFILSNALRKFERVRSVRSIGQPIRVSSAPDEQRLDFDFAFFAALRSLCSAFVAGGNINGIVESLYCFEVGVALNDLGLGFAGESFLRRACSLRSRFTVQSQVMRTDAALYQRAVNFCLLHEHAHLHFERDPEVRGLWLTRARGFLHYLSKSRDDAALHADKRMRDELATAAARFQLADLAVEEVASDLYALDSAIRHEAANLPLTLSGIVDRCATAARLTIIIVYVARTIAESARLVKGAIAMLDAGSEIGTLPQAEAFLSDMRLRSQVALLGIAFTAAEMTGAQGQVDVKTLIPPHDEVFGVISATLTAELIRCQDKTDLYEAIVVGREVGTVDNRAAIEALAVAYLKDYWPTGLFLGA